MSLTLDLPPSLDRELSLEAQREGISPHEHATLLLHLASALLHEGQPTPFQQAVRDYISHRALDTEHLALVLDDLVRVCVEAQDTGKLLESFQQLLEESGDREAAKSLPTLRAWRDAVVHEPLDRHSQGAGRVSRARGKYAGLIGSSEEFAAEKRRELAKEDAPHEPGRGLRRLRSDRLCPQ